ncbi:hypothetical protein [Streptomyces sp. NPDC050534]|uniref:hypothetical protein n=1 Tax=Streptomyces sp. NPDC050534 TaxID=3365625 RepID=UPI0037B59059
MYDLPEPPATTGQAANPLTDAVIRAAVDNAIHEARRTGTSPQAVIGSTPPVVQTDGGRPPMSQQATDASALMLSGGVASVLVGGAASLVMIASGHADPTVCGIVFGAPAATFLAASRLLKRAKQAMPDTHHHHYNGPVQQDTRITQTRAVWSKTINKH